MNAERAARIQQLQGDVDQHRENIRQREEARAQNPILMDEYIRGEQQTAPVQRDVGQAGLQYRVTETAAVTATAEPFEMDAESSARWNGWLDKRFEVERRENFDIIARQMAEFVSEYLHQKLQPLRTEIGDLRRDLAARDERARALGEVKRELAGERVEREALQLASALAARDAKIEKLEEKLGMLLRFLSLQGYDLPKGTM
jgi:hypothetical protein